MFERFSAEARRVVIQAQHEARALQHQAIGTEHLLLALTGARADAGSGSDPAAATLQALGITHESAVSRLRGLTGTGELDATALESIGIDLAEIQRRIEERFGSDALTDPPTTPQRRSWLRRVGADHLPFSAEAKRALEETLRAATERRDRQLGTMHLLLGVLRAGGLGVRLIEMHGTTPAAVRAELDRRLRDSA